MSAPSSSASVAGVKILSQSARQPGISEAACSGGL